METLKKGPTTLSNSSSSLIILEENEPNLSNLNLDQDKDKDTLNPSDSVVFDMIDSYQNNFTEETSYMDLINLDGKISFNF